MKSVLAEKFRDNLVKIVDNITTAEPKTKKLLEVLNNINVTGKKILIIKEKADENLVKSARNLQEVEIKVGKDVNTYDILNSTDIVIEKNSIDILKSRLID